MTSGAYEGLVDACNACADACDTCLSACLLESHAADLTRCIALDLECALTCRLLAGFAVRGSKFAGGVAAACLELCDACADECGKHDHDHCRRCAEACRACAAACRRLLAIRPETPLETGGNSPSAPVAR